MEMMPSNQPTDVATQQIKVPLASLPPGTKEGDKLELTVKGIDPVSSMAIMAHADEKAESAVKDEVTDDADEEAPSEPSMDTKTLLGPMNGLKNYLVQKSQDVPKNQGR